MKNIENEVKILVAEIIEREVGEIDPNARFAEDLGVDSMKAIEIMAAIEKKFKINIPEEKLVKLATLNDAIALAKEFIHKKNN